MGGLERRLGRLEEQLRERLEAVLVKALLEEELREMLAILRAEMDAADYWKIVRVWTDAGYIESTTSGQAQGTYLAAKRDTGGDGKTRFYER